MEPVVPGGVKPRAAEPATIDLTGGKKKKDKALSKLKTVEHAEYVKKSASGYGKYGTKQDCIEGALEELDTMIKHYNLICMKKLGNK